MAAEWNWLRGSIDNFYLTHIQDNFHLASNIDTILKLELNYLRGQSLSNIESHSTRSQLQIEILKLFSSAILQRHKGSQAIRKYPSDLSNVV